MIATSFKEVIIEMMGEIAKAIPDSHTSVGVGFQKNFVEINLDQVMEMF